MSLRLGVPSKGRLMEKTFAWFGAHGIMLSRSGSEREYAAEVHGIDGLELVLLSAGEIPRELQAGRIHLGVTGTDLIREKLVNWEQRVEPLVELGFGHADLIIAVPDCWVDVETVDDLMARPRPFAKPTDFGCGSPQNIIVWCGNFYAVLAWLIIVWWTVKAPLKAR